MAPGVAGSIPVSHPFLNSQEQDVLSAVRSSSGSLCCPQSAARQDHCVVRSPQLVRIVVLSAVRASSGSLCCPQSAPRQGRCVVRSPQSKRVVSFAVRRNRSVAQLVEHRSPKPGVAGSIPAGPVENRRYLARSEKVFVVLALSSRGLGRGPLKAQTRVRIPLALLKGYWLLAMGYWQGLTRDRCGGRL